MKHALLALRETLPSDTENLTADNVSIAYLTTESKDVSLFDGDELKVVDGKKVGDWLKLLESNAMEM